jgi:hypothetical protein
MGWRITGAVSGVDADVDTNRNLQVVQGIPAIAAAGGYYSVTGQSGAVAASLAANTNLMSMRLVVGSTRKAYITRFRVLVVESTAVGTAALVPGAIGIQRFTAQTPTGGTARTALRNNENAGTVTDVTDIRDSAAALTGTAPTWGTVAAMFNVPLFVTSGALWYEFIWEPEYPLALAAGDGLGIRTQVVMPATQQWAFSYGVRWFEQ